MLSSQPSNSNADFNVAIVKRGCCRRLGVLLAKLFGVHERPSAYVVRTLSIVVATATVSSVWVLLTILRFIDYSRGVNPTQTLGVAVSCAVCFAASVISFVVFFITKEALVIFVVHAIAALSRAIAQYILYDFTFTLEMIPYALTITYYSFAAFGKCQQIFWSIISVLVLVFVVSTQICFFFLKDNVSIFPLTPENKLADSSSFGFKQWGVHFFATLVPLAVPLLMAIFTIWQFHRDSQIHLRQLESVAEGISRLDLEENEAVKKIEGKSDSISSPLEKMFQLILKNMKLYKSFIPSSLYQTISGTNHQDGAEESKDDAEERKSHGSHRSETNRGMELYDESALSEISENYSIEEKVARMERDKSKKNGLDRTNDLSIGLGVFRRKSVTFVTILWYNAFDLLLAGYEEIEDDAADTKKSVLPEYGLQAGDRFCMLHLTFVELIAQRATVHGGTVSDILDFDRVLVTFNSVRTKLSHEKAGCDFALELADHLSRVFSVPVPVRNQQIVPEFRISVRCCNSLFGHLGSTQMRRFVHIRGNHCESCFPPGVGFFWKRMEMTKIEARKKPDCYFASDVPASLSHPDYTSVFVDHRVHDVVYYDFLMELCDVSLFVDQRCTISSVDPVYLLKKRYIQHSQSQEWMYCVPPNLLQGPSSGSESDVDVGSPESLDESSSPLKFALNAIRSRDWEGAMRHIDELGKIPSSSSKDGEETAVDQKESCERRALLDRLTEVVRVLRLKDNPPELL